MRFFSWLYLVEQQKTCYEIILVLNLVCVTVNRRMDKGCFRLNVNQGKDKWKLQDTLWSKKESSYSPTRGYFLPGGIRRGSHLSDILKRECKKIIKLQRCILITNHNHLGVSSVIFFAVFKNTKEEEEETIVRLLRLYACLCLIPRFCRWRTSPPR